MVVSNAFRVDPERGAIRFWYRPDWGSESGPGNVATLATLVSGKAGDEATWWSLVVTSDGREVHLLCQTDSGAQSCLKAEINWSPGGWKLITVAYTPTNSALFMDDLRIADGTGLQTVPKGAWPFTSLVLGSTLSGADSASGQMEELSMFTGRSKFLRMTGHEFGLIENWDVSIYYAGHSKLAALGPISEDEEAAKAKRRAEMKAKREAEAEEGGGGEMMMRMSGPAISCVTNGAVYLTNVLAELNAATGWTVYFDIAGGTNGVPYDVFSATNLVGNHVTNSFWRWEEIGYTCNRYFYTNQSSARSYYMLGTSLDSDFDGLPNAFEILVTRTNPQLRDSDSDGIPDGDELNSAGVPWRLVRAGQTQVIIYTTTATATEGGGCGQFAVRLPSPAPAGGVQVRYRLGNAAVLNTDYTLTPAANTVTIPAGSVTAQIGVCAINDTAYNDYDREVEITLTNANVFPVNPSSATVVLADNDPPAVRVLALPAWIREPSATYGTNTAEFYFIRDGDAVNALTVLFSKTGMATSGADYDALPASITFPAGERTYSLPVNLKWDNVTESDESLTVSITSAPGYQIDPANGSAMLTIAANGLPAVPVIQVTATDDVASEAGLTPGQFTFTRTGPTPAMRVFYRVTGNANVASSSSPRDYVALPGFVDFPAGAASVNVSVTPLDDTLSETMETIVLVLAGGGDYLIGANNSAVVYLDDNEPTSFNTQLIRHGVYGSSVRKPCEVRVTRYGSALSANSLTWHMSYSFLGNTLSSTLGSGSVSGNRVVWAARQSVATVGFNTYWANYADTTVNPFLTMTNATVNQSLTIPYHPPSSIVTVQSLVSPATTVTEGTTVAGALIFRRPYPNGNSFSLFFTKEGSATDGVDYLINGSSFSQVTFGANVSQVAVPVQALVNSQTNGWRTAIVSVDGTGSGNQVADTALSRAFIRIQDAQISSPTPDTDMDDDGLSDGFELANLGTGYDPDGTNNPYADTDRDGLSLFEEIQLGTNPNVADAQPQYPSEDPDDYVPLTLRIGAMGKLGVNQANCALCHEVGLRSGNHTRTSPRVTWENPNGTVDYLIRYLRGTDYPVRLLCNPYTKVLAISQTNGVTPAYTARYTAQFQTRTNTPYPFITDIGQLTGSNRPMLLEQLSKTAMLHVPDMSIATDVDRDGVVNPKSRVDRTSPEKPFAFWINDDSDYGDNDAAEDRHPTANPINSATAGIDGLRDLEDFARLHLYVEGLPGSLATNANIQARVYVTNITGVPMFRVFPSADSSGSISYLTNSGTSQASRTALGILSQASSPLMLNASA